LRAVIFANGLLNQSRYIDQAVVSGKLLIAANGGAHLCLQLGYFPDLVIGDLDSLSSGDLEDLRERGAEIISYPKRKDYTDLELALNHALQAGADEILVIGALGKRWDQTLANLLLPASPVFNQVTVRLLDGLQEINLIHPDQTLEIFGEEGDIVSLIPVLGDAKGITTTGLEYPLADESLSFGSTRGVSNEMVGRQASVRLESGLLACILIHKDYEENRSR
jgi:thiamine pyrophosphokinase